MGEPAVVLGDQVTGMCPTHLIVNVATGAPQPAPPLPFAAPLLSDLAMTVLVGGKPAAVLGTWGLNTPPHPLHPSDPFFAPPTQQGRVTGGSATVLFAGRPAAKTGSPCMCCSTPGAVVGTAASVLIGG